MLLFPVPNFPWSSRFGSHAHSLRASNWPSSVAQAAEVYCYEIVSHYLASSVLRAEPNALIRGKTGERYSPTAVLHQMRRRTTRGQVPRGVFLSKMLIAPMPRKELREAAPI